MIRLLTGDPGKDHSRFAVILSDVLATEIRILAAQEWPHTDYTLVANEIDQKIHAKHRFIEFVVEYNNVGKAVVDIFRRYHSHIPLFTVNTTGKITDPQKIQDGHSMYKEGTAEYARLLYQTGIVKFPRQTTPGIEELKRQLGNFLPHVGTTGSIKYYSEGKERDDLVMAFLLLCHRARAFLGQDLQLALASAPGDLAYLRGQMSAEQKILDQPRIKAILNNLGMNISKVKVEL